MFMMNFPPWMEKAVTLGIYGAIGYGTYYVAKKTGAKKHATGIALGAVAAVFLWRSRSSAQQASGSTSIVRA